MQDQEKWYLASGMEHVDHCGYEYLAEMYFSVVLCSLERTLDPVMQAVASSIKLFCCFAHFYTAIGEQTFVCCKSCARSKKQTNQPASQIISNIVVLKLNNSRGIQAQKWEKES